MSDNEADNVPDHISISSNDHNDGDEVLFKGGADSPVVTESLAGPKVTRSKTPIHIARTIRADFPKATHKRNTSSISSASNVIKTITDSLDSDARSKRDHNRGQQHLEGLQFLTMTQQLRDANATIDSLRREITTLQYRLNASERQQDHSRFELQMVQLQRNSRASRRHARRVSSPPRRHAQRDSSSPRIDSNGRRLYERRVQYPDQGEARYYVRSDDEDPLFAPQWNEPDYGPPLSHGNDAHRDMQIDDVPASG